MFYSKFSEDYEQIFPFNEKIYFFLKSFLPSANTSILDIGCATGHYCGKFTADGYNISGIDLDQGMIQTAVGKYPGVNFKVLNLVDIASLNTGFGMVYSTGNVMAHISIAEFKIFLSSLKRKMPGGGIWIFQVINWDYILQQNSYTFS